MPHILTIVSPRALTTPQIAAFTKLGGHSVYELGPDAADIRFAEAPVWDEVNELATEHGFDFAIHDNLVHAARYSLGRKLVNVVTLLSRRSLRPARAAADAASSRCVHANDGPTRAS